MKGFSVSNDVSLVEDRAWSGHMGLAFCLDTEACSEMECASKLEFTKRLRLRAVGCLLVPEQGRWNRCASVCDIEVARV